MHESWFLMRNWLQSKCVCRRKNIACMMLMLSITLLMASYTLDNFPQGELKASFGVRQFYLSSKHLNFKHQKKSGKFMDIFYYLFLREFYFMGWNL